MGSNTIDTLWLLVCTALLLLQQTGFLCLESGLTRKKNNINTAIKNFVDFSFIFILFWLVGYNLAFSDSAQTWFGSIEIFQLDAEDTNYQVAFFLFQALFACTTVTLISGAIAERMQFRGYLLIACWMTILVYPIFAFSVWHEKGWLGTLGFYDFAGASVIHIVGGMTALIATLIIGPREGRFNQDGSANDVPASNLSTASLGALFLFIGWIGFNGGSTGAFSPNTAHIILVTILAGMAGLITITSYFLITNKPIFVSPLINGLLSPLVAVAGSADIISAELAILLGVITAPFCEWVSRVLEKYNIDDPIGAIPVHLGGGIVGILAIGFIPDSSADVITQLIGILVCIVWTTACFLPFLYICNRLSTLRVSKEDEKIGLNISEHGAHNDLYNLLNKLDTMSSDLKNYNKIDEEPFTEIGLIAKHFNGLLEKIAKYHSQLLDEKDKAVKASEAKDLFLAKMSHELRTPMNGIIGMLELVDKSGVNEEQKRKLLVAKKSSESLLNIINDILDFSKINSDKVKLENIPFSVVELITDVGQAFYFLAAKKGIELTVDSREVEQDIVIGDPVRMRQILSNILNNAIKFTSEGFISIKLSSKSIDNSRVKVTASITDSGVGISKEGLKKLFKPFSQENDSTSRAYGGTGLGLSICKSLCEMMQGTINVTSEKENGSCFSFEVFLEIGKPDQNKIVVNNDYSGLNALLIEKNNYGKGLLTNHLVDMGFFVRNLEDLTEGAAIENYDNKEKYSLIIIDLECLSNNESIFDLISKNDMTREAGIIVLDSIVNSLHEDHEFKQGISGCIQKPIIFTEMKKVIDSILDSNSSCKPNNVDEINNKAGSDIDRLLDIRILIVEDNLINQEVAKCILESFGFNNLDIVENGQEALEIIKENSKISPFDLIFMDCQMPVMDGFEATKSIRLGKAGEPSKTIPIIALTANAVKGDREKCIEVGMNDFVSKPVDSNHLIDAIKNCFESK